MLSTGSLRHQNLSNGYAPCKNAQCILGRNAGLVIMKHLLPVWGQLVSNTLIILLWLWPCHSLLWFRLLKQCLRGKKKTFKAAFSKENIYWLQSSPGLWKCHIPLISNKLVERISRQQIKPLHLHVQLSKALFFKRCEEGQCDGGLWTLNRSEKKGVIVPVVMDTGVVWTCQCRECGPISHCWTMEVCSWS